MNISSSYGKFVPVCVDTPLDHLSLLDPILGHTGCLRSANDVNLLVKYMETSSQMVSQCIVINILKNTRAPSTLERFVHSKGWAILSDWLKFAKEKNEVTYLIELIHILLKFPQTIESLKQGGIGKNIKQLCKSDNIVLQKSSKNVLIKWKKFLKEKQLPKIINKSFKNSTLFCLQGSNHEVDISTSDVKDLNLSTTTHALNSQENKAVVKADLNQPNIRLTKPICRDVKKLHTSNITDNKLNIMLSHTLSDRITDLTSLDTNTNTSQCNFSDKVNAITQDNGSFTSLKGSNDNIGRKLTSVKSSLVESKKFSEAIFESSNRRSTLKRFSSTTNFQRSGIERLSPDEVFIDNASDRVQRTTDRALSIGTPSNLDPFEADSPSLAKSHIHKRVTWAPGESLTEVRFIEVDNSDSCSNQVHGNFYDAIMEEKRAERYALAHIFANDRMLALVQWNHPRLIDFLEPLVDPGCKSEELHCQNNRERSVLAVLFLTKDSAPDDPGEPEIDEIQSFKEPKIIPLYEPGKEPLQDNNSNSPVKSNLPFPNIYLHSEFPRQFFTPVSQTLHNIPPLPFASQYHILNTSTISSLNPLTSEKTKQLTFPNQVNNVATPPIVSPDAFANNFPSFIPPNSNQKHYFKAFGSRGRRKNKIPCQHYIKGYCKKGQLCEYLH